MGRPSKLEVLPILAFSFLVFIRTFLLSVKGSAALKTLRVVLTSEKSDLSSHEFSFPFMVIGLLLMIFQKSNEMPPFVPSDQWAWHEFFFCFPPLFLNDRM